MSDKYRIVVGSTSKHKVGAAKEACRRLDIHAEVLGCKTISEVNEQPVGFRETTRGAKQRALAAKAQQPDTVSIGIESGIVVSGDVVIDLAVIAVLWRGKWYLSTSPGIQFPHSCYVIAKKRGFDKHTVGSVIAEQLGGDETDPHTFLTTGRITRQETLVQGLCVALGQMLAAQ
jgi:non-canonical (house-cleaning) NTP pyrophosphatase